MRLPVAVCFSILAFLPSARAQQNPKPLVENSHRGFDKQYKAIFKAFRKSDDLTLRSRFADFAIPSHWFTDTFGLELGPRIADRYSQEFEKFIYATTNLFGSVDNANNNSVGTHIWKYDHGTQPVPTPAPSSIRPLLPVQYFGVDYGSMGNTGPHGVLDWGSNTSWKGCFIYVDGAFRFFGLEAYPFWDLLDDQPSGFCADPRVQGGQIIHKVKPEYPLAARKDHIQGSVELRVSIAKDGSVMLAEVIGGDPLLRDAARHAVMLWHYYPPFRKCSQPVESAATEFVIFPPR